MTVIRTGGVAGAHCVAGVQRKHSYKGTVFSFGVGGRGQARQSSDISFDCLRKRVKVMINVSSQSEWHSWGFTNILKHSEI